MPDPVLDWLLDAENPSVRFFALSELLQKPLSDPEVLAARSAIMTQGLVPRILSAQNDDGSWVIPEKFYTLKYTGTVWTLMILADLAADPADPRVRKACEFILEHCWSPESGGFAYSQSARTKNGLASAVLPCLTGNMVSSLIRMGYLDDSRVQQAINWISTWQRADDGIEKMPEGILYKHYPMCWGRHSCHMGVAKTMKALAEIPAERRSPAARAKLEELAEYFLIHHLYKRSRNLDEISRPGWLKPGFPLMYQTDILELLGIFARLGRWDLRLLDALRILQGKMASDGRWNLEQTSNGKMLVRIEQKGAPSRWITLKARLVLQHFADYLES